MSIGMLGRKLGMTQILTADGIAVPVSVVEIAPNRVSQLKNVEQDGYSGVQITGGTQKASRVSKPLAGHFAKAGIEAGDIIAEFRVDSIQAFTLGQVLTIADVFSDGQFVDVMGITKGKGFAGGVKRHNFRTQDATHGNSRSHRVIGSTGQNQTPGRVFKGKKMAGHLGHVRQTTQSLQVVRVDCERNLLLIKGAIPGAPGAKITVKPAVKVQKRGE